MLKAENCLKSLRSHLCSQQKTPRCLLTTNLGFSCSKLFFSFSYMQSVLEATLWEGGRSGLERLWVRPLEVNLTGVCLPHTPKSYVRDKRSAHCGGTQSPLPDSPCPSHFPRRVCEIAVPIMARIRFTDEARMHRIRSCDLALCVCTLALEH